MFHWAIWFDAIYHNLIETPLTQQYPKLCPVQWAHCPTNPDGWHLHFLSCSWPGTTMWAFLQILNQRPHSKCCEAELAAMQCLSANMCEVMYDHTIHLLTYFSYLLTYPLMIFRSPGLWSLNPNCHHVVWKNYHDGLKAKSPTTAQTLTACWTVAQLVVNAIAPDLSTSATATQLLQSCHVSSMPVLSAWLSSLIG